MLFLCLASCSTTWAPSAATTDLQLPYFLDREQPIPPVMLVAPSAQFASRGERTSYRGRVYVKALVEEDGHVRKLQFN